MKTIYDHDTQNHKLDFSDEMTLYETVLKQVAHAIAHDREEKVKRALIELGWTPPSEVPK